MPAELIHADNVSKKFCRSLKRSMWYGVRDMVSEALGGHGGQGRLRRDEFWAVDGVSLTLRRGECLGLIGHNGAGKTTLLKLLNGVIKPNRGRIVVRGRVGALIALGAGFNPLLSGRENIHVNAAVFGLSRAQSEAKLDEIIEFAGIREFIDSPVRTYSSGMAVRLGFAIATAFEPDVLLLDEVLAVGDMGFQAKCFNRLGESRRRGTGFILVSHNMHHVTRFCERVLYLARGRPVFCGDVREGVALFQQEMARPARFGAGENASATEESGSMTVVVEEAFFANAGGVSTTRIRSGDPAHLVLRYRCRLGPVRDPVLEVVLRDPHGDALFQGTSRGFRADLGELSDTGTLLVRFAAIPANNLTLTASIALWDASMRELIYWRRGIELEVHGDPQSTGRILLQCTWQHQPGAGASEPSRPAQVPIATPPFPEPFSRA
jgi:lipopolysaccharide transport system ATP-binding protein